MPEIIHFIDPTKASKITSLAFGPNGNTVSVTSNTDELVTTSGINPIYDDRFKARTVDADSLETHPGYFYLDRANHSGAAASSSDAATLNTKSGHYYLDRANHSGTMNVSNLVGTINASQLNSLGPQYYLDRTNHSGTNNATLLNGSGGHYFLDRSNHSGTMNASNLVGTINASQLNSLGPQYYLDRANHSGTVNATQINGSGAHYYLDMANFSGDINNRSVYMSGVGYSVSSGVSNTIGFKSGTYTINWATSNLQTINLSGALTIAFSGAQNGSRLQLMINQDAVGSRVITWPASTILKWPGGTAPTLTTTASGVDMIALYVDNGKYYGTSALDFR
jgi:hypothetical protein